MRQINRIVILLALLLMGEYAAAQPPARKKEQKNDKAKTAATYEVPLSERAKSQYPTTTTPEEVVWKRDIYRTVDLEKEQNAVLYYPVEPIGKQMNLSTETVKKAVFEIMNKTGAFTREELGTFV